MRNLWKHDRSQRVKEKPNAPDTTHDCCDACREICDCETCTGEQLSPDKEVSEPLPTLSRTVEEEEWQLLRELLKEIQTKTGHASTVFGCAELSTELDQELIDSISSNFQYIFSIDYIMDNFPIFISHLWWPTVLIRKNSQNVITNRKF